MTPRWRVGRETLEEAGKMQEGSGSEYIEWHEQVEGSGGRYREGAAGCRWQVWHKGWKRAGVPGEH
jgi:hypothetical protein